MCSKVNDKNWVGIDTIIEANEYPYTAWTGIEAPINYYSCPLTCNALSLNYADTLAKS